MPCMHPQPLQQKFTLTWIHLKLKTTKPAINGNLRLCDNNYLRLCIYLLFKQQGKCTHFNKYQICPPQIFRSTSSYLPYYLYISELLQQILNAPFLQTLRKDLPTAPLRKLNLLYLQLNGTTKDANIVTEDTTTTQILQHAFAQIHLQSHCTIFVFIEHLPSFTYSLPYKQLSNSLGTSYQLHLQMTREI